MLPGRNLVHVNGEQEQWNSNKMYANGFCVQHFCVCYLSGLLQQG